MSSYLIGLCAYCISSCRPMMTTLSSPKKPESPHMQEATFRAPFARKKSEHEIAGIQTLSCLFGRSLR